MKRKIYYLLYRAGVKVPENYAQQFYKEMKANMPEDHFFLNLSMHLLNRQK